jgi:hypothetical protein
MDEATHKKNYKPITLRDMFMDKNPRLGRWIPRFVFSAGSRILRIDFFNYPLLYSHGAQLVKDHVYIIAEDPERKFRSIKN